MFTKQQIKIILEVGSNLVGEKYKGLKCHDFIKKIYEMAGISTNFNDFPTFSLNEIWTEKAVGYLIFLHRKKTKTVKKITHIGIIFPDNNILHYSRWMNGEPGFYQVFLSPFEEIFKIYNFVEPCLKLKPMV